MGVGVYEDDDHALEEVVPSKIDPTLDPEEGAAYTVPSTQQRVVVPSVPSVLPGDAEGYYWDWFNPGWALYGGPYGGLPWWYPGYWSMASPYYWYYGSGYYWPGRRGHRLRRSGRATRGRKLGGGSGRHTQRARRPGPRSRPGRFSGSAPARRSGRGPRRSGTGGGRRTGGRRGARMRSRAAFRPRPVQGRITKAVRKKAYKKLVPKQIRERIGQLQGQLRKLRVQAKKYALLAKEYAKMAGSPEGRTKIMAKLVEVHAQIEAKRAELKKQTSDLRKSATSRQVSSRGRYAALSDLDSCEPRTRSSRAGRSRQLRSQESLQVQKYSPVNAIRLPRRPRRPRRQQKPRPGQGTKQEQIEDEHAVREEQINHHDRLYYRLLLVIAKFKRTKLRKWRREAVALAKKLLKYDEETNFSSNDWIPENAGFFTPEEVPGLRERASYLSAGAGYNGRDELLVMVRVETKTPVRPRARTGHPWFGKGSRLGYSVSVGGSTYKQGARIQVKYGQRVRFSVNAKGHPLYITRNRVGGTRQLGSPLMGIRRGTSFGHLVLMPSRDFDLTENEVDQLTSKGGASVKVYYQCDQHPYMGGVFEILPTPGEIGFY